MSVLTPEQVKLGAEVLAQIERLDALADKIWHCRKDDGFWELTTHTFGLFESNSESWIDILFDHDDDDDDDDVSWVGEGIAEYLLRGVFQRRLELAKLIVEFVTVPDVPEWAGDI